MQYIPSTKPNTTSRSSKKEHHKTAGEKTDMDVSTKMSCGITEDKKRIPLIVQKGEEEEEELIASRSSQGERNQKIMAKNETDHRRCGRVQT